MGYSIFFNAMFAFVSVAILLHSLRVFTAPREDFLFLVTIQYIWIAFRWLKHTQETKADG